MGFFRTLTFLTIVAAANGQQPVVLHPRISNDVFANPGIGIQTFQRFNGDPLNGGVTWSEEGPTAPIVPGAPPTFPPSSISYCRWFWMTLEPEQGHVRWTILDNALKEAHAHGQKLAIRLMPYDKNHPLPLWYQQSGAKRANAANQPIWEPDFSDARYLQDWGALVKAAGKRYDGNPDLDTVDISSVGYWGEGWSDYMPAFAVQQKLIDIWFEAFPKTRLLMNFDEPQALAYGTQRGAGWRADCLGDLRAKWSHMLDFYPEQIARTNIGDVWKHSPVSLETCWVPAYWQKQGWDAQYILDEALRWHISSLNVKSNAIPPEYGALFDTFQRRMGYRFELRRIEYPSAVKSGSAAEIKMWWVNSGVAPIYQPYTLALAFDDHVVKLKNDVRSWLPGDAVVEGPVAIPPIAAKTYHLRVALLDPVTGSPAVRLGIEGRAADGWYDLGNIQVDR